MQRVLIKKPVWLSNHSATILLAGIRRTERAKDANIGNPRFLLPERLARHPVQHTRQAQLSSDFVWVRNTDIPHLEGREVREVLRVSVLGEKSLAELR